MKSDINNSSFIAAFNIGKSKGRTQGILIGIASVVCGNIIGILILQLLR